MRGGFGGISGNKALKRWCSGLLTISLLFFSPYKCFPQYLPILLDSAFWRYRLFDYNGSITIVRDLTMLYSGIDTAVAGNTYHQIVIRSCSNTFPAASLPPVTDMHADQPDVVFRYIREAGHQVYYLNAGADQLMFDYDAVAGTAVPDFGGTVLVTGVDSILLNDGLYHRRLLTTNALFTPIEGVGSNLGLFPDFNSGDITVKFYCYDRNALTYRPLVTDTCTNVYPYGSAGVAPIGHGADAFRAYPDPATGELFFEGGVVGDDLSVVDIWGRVVWQGRLSGSNVAVDVTNWERGIYYYRLTGSENGELQCGKVVVY